MRPMARLTKKQFEEHFRAEILPQVIGDYEQHRFIDKPARRQAWNDTVDAYIRDRRLPASAGDWAHPRWLETYRPLVREGLRQHATRKVPRKKGTIDVMGGYKVDLDRGGQLVRGDRIDTTTPGDYGADPLGDGTFRMVPSGDVVDFAERTRRLDDYAKRSRRGHAKKKSPAQLDREIAEALGRFPYDDADLQAKYRVTPSDLRVGQRFDYLGRPFEIVKIGRDKDKTIQVARRYTKPSGKDDFIDHRSFPMREFYRQHLRPLRG
jgi:hypothetical protein